MDFEKLLKQRYSKETIQGIAEFLVQNPDSLHSYLKIIKDGKPGMSQRAAWALGHAGEMDKTILIPHLSTLIEILQHPKHDAVTRNIYRVLQYVNIPEDFEGRIYNLCIRDLINPKQPVAVKCFGMTTAYNISKKHKELQSELKMVIEENLENASAGYKSRAKKILPKLEVTNY